MSINNLNTYLNVRDAHLRVVSGNVYAQAMNIGGINVETAHGLQSVSDTGNVTSNTLQFSNATTGFVTTANVQIGRDLVVTGNATVSTDLTVSANATVTDTLTVSEHLIASKEATVTGNLHVTTIRSDSNVVAEYTGPHDRPLRKYPEVALTADDNLSTSGYKASVSSLLTGNDAFRAFDATGATSFWHSQYPYYTFVTGTYNPGQSALGTGTPANGTTLPTTELISGHQGEWIKLQMPKKIKLEEVRVYASNRAAAGINVYQMPKDIAIAGSNDGTNWYLVDSGTLRTGIRESYGMASLPVTTSSYYSYLALIVKSTDNQGANYSAVEIANIEYYGREEGSGSLDTTLKTVYNVPATTGTQLEVYYDGQDYGPSVPTSITDKTGNGNNTTTVGSGIGFDSTYKAFTFDGTANGKIEGTHGLGTGTGIQYSMSLWFKADVLSGNHRLATFGTQGTQYQSSTLLIYQNDIHLDHWLSEIKTTSDILVPNVWYHLVAIHTGPGTEDVSQNALYLNGVKLEDVTTGGSAANGTFNLQGTGLTIGADSAGTNPFDGSIANFRLYSKVLNADQVKELYDFQKDYFLGSKSQVTLYKGHLGVGVTEPSGQLELAGDERIQEYPPRAFETSAGSNGPDDLYIEGHGHFKAWSTSSYGPDYTAGGAFTKSNSHTYDSWISAAGDWELGTTSTGLPGANAPTFAGYKGGHLILELPYSILLKSFIVDERLNLARQLPSVFVIIASNDGINWDTIFNHTATAGIESDYAGNIFSVNATKTYSQYGFVALKNGNTNSNDHLAVGEWRLFGTPGPTTLVKGSLTLGRSLDVPRVSRYDVDTETPRPEKLVVDFDTTVNSSPTDISGQGNHGTFYNGAEYSAADKAFKFVGVDNNNQAANSSDTVRGTHGLSGTRPVHSHSVWFKQTTDASDYTWVCAAGTATGQQQSGILLSGSSSYPNRITFDCYNGWVTSTVTAELNRWYHVVATFNGGTTFNTTNCRIYVDGVDCTGPSSEVYNEQTFNLQGAILALGSTHNGTRGLTGLVSNYKLYNVVLEPSEVRKLYNLGRTGRSMVISDTAVGIGKAPEAQLDVRGILNVDGVITNQQRPAFYVWRDGTGDNIEAIGHGGGSRLAVTGVITNWDSKRIDTAGTFDLSNGRYYIPVSGLYMFIGAGVYRYQSGNGILEASFYVNGSLIGPRGISYNRGNTTSEHHTVTITFMRFMNAGDYVQMGVPVAHSACDLYYGDNLGYFSGYLLG